VSLIARRDAEVNYAFEVAPDLRLIVAVCIAASLISLVLAPAYADLFGVLPVFVGIKKFFALRRGGGDKEGRQPHEAHSGVLGQIASVTAVTIANGGDNIGVYAPLFAARRTPETAVIVIVFMVMTALWVGLAHRLVNHARAGVPIRRYGHITAPFVLIGLGLFILYGARSLNLLRLAGVRNS
jgi:cadmium resistance protein CadD (predicted permease)